MSVASVRAEIGKFLGRADAEVLCIRGKWGVGKPYLWRQQFDVAKAAKQIAAPHYSYMSLFGVNSLDELKLAMFENVQSTTLSEDKSALQTIDALMSERAGWRAKIKYLEKIPGLSKFLSTDLMASVAFLRTERRLICIDDLERRGDKLSIRDVLGMISYLREERECKIVLILNDQQLGADTKDFEQNLEKVVDISALYQPKPEDSVRIAIPETDELGQQIAERCIALGITNIRVIRRARRLVKEAQKALAAYDDDVFKAAMPSIVLYSWSNDQPDEAPPLSFLREQPSRLFGLNNRKKEVTPDEANWTALLEAYGYLHTDDLDLVLMQAVCDGHFDPEQTSDAFRAAHERALASKANGSFEDSWRAYHDSFNNNADEVLDGIYASFMKNFRHVSPTNLNGSVMLFKELGRDEQAQEMISCYVANRDDGPKLFDLSENPFGSSVTHPDIQAAFAAKFTEVTVPMDIDAILLAKRNSWGEEEMAALASAPVDDYLKVFKSHSGEEFQQIMANAFQYARVGNANGQMQQITEKSKAALTIIGAESPINARRVSRYCVTPELPDEADLDL
jgi:hypothetical protein